jgi:putative peptide zinc metalloprotease protein
MKLPERPELAEEVTLEGEMQETAFKHPPYLIQRSGQFIQVPQVLYAVAEAIDGKRTVAQIADVASDATQIRIEPDQAAELIARLIAQGIVKQADGTVAEGPQTEGYNPLKLNMKMGFIGPRAIRPITFVLQWAFFPPVLVGLLAATIAGLAWMYGVHGVGNGIHEVFYKPQLMLAVLGLVILSAIAHEFGHASALRYGGGEARQMGVGLYMVYPAFYTDVTDSYRLRRWGKVRTDAGGLYFNFLFCLALIGIAFIAKQDWLLLVVALINFEMMHQLLPLGRMDGYWALADLVGLPDFFSRMMPFLRSVLPGWFPISDGPKLPDLKTKAKVIFVLYLVTVIPLLCFFLFLMVRALPRIIATGVAGFGEQADQLSQHWRDGDFALVAVSALQIFVVGLATFGVLYVVTRLGAKLFLAINRWSRPSPFRRVVGTMGTSFAMVGLVMLWLPQTPLPGGAEVSGPLYQASNFRPIEQGERLTVGDAVKNRTVVRDQSGHFIEKGKAAAPASPSPSPTSSPSPGKTAAPARIPSTTPLAGGGHEPSPKPTRAPTEQVTATPAPTDAPTEPPSPTVVPTDTPPTSP